jgi:hypothetical protein
VVNGMIVSNWPEGILLQKSFEIKLSALLPIGTLLGNGSVKTLPRKRVHAQ